MTRLVSQAYQDKYSDRAKMTPKITVYFLQASRSIRTVWLLEELELFYKLETSNRVNQKAPQEFKDKSGSPLGKFPSIRDDDEVMNESGAICEYICEKYDETNRLFPKNEHLRNQVRTWIHASEATFMLHGLAVLYARWNLPEDVRKNQPEVLEKMEENLSVNVHKAMDWLEASLGRSTGNFLVGDKLTAADIMMEFSAEFLLARELGTKGRKWPKIEEWLKRCHETPSYKRAVDKSGHTLYPEST